MIGQFQSNYILTNQMDESGINVAAFFILSSVRLKKPRWTNAALNYQVLSWCAQSSKEGSILLSKLIKLLSASKCTPEKLNIRTHN